MRIVLTNWKYLEYTYLHRKALVYTINKLITDEGLKERMLERAEIHDLDKSTLYLFLPKEDASNYHRNHAPHHVENSIPKTKNDLIETVLDYECAGYTKIDKPLNAYDTIKQFNPSHKEELLEIVRELGIDYSYRNADDEEFKEYIKQYTPVSPNDVLQEIFHYLDIVKNNVLINGPIIFTDPKNELQ